MKIIFDPDRRTIRVGDFIYSADILADGFETRPGEAVRISKSEPMGDGERVILFSVVGESSVSAAAARVCHDEQMIVWTGEVEDALNLAGFLRDDLDYDDGVQLNGVLAREIRRIVESAFDHPELKLVQSTTLDETR